MQFLYLPIKSTGSYNNIIPDLVETLQFFDFPYRMWVSLRTTNIIERVFREFRR